MSLLSLIPKLIEKTQQGKISWVKGDTCEFQYISSDINFNRIHIEQIPSVNENTVEPIYYVKLFSLKLQEPTLEFMEKVEIGKISGLLKEVRNQVLHKNYSTKLDELKNYLETL